MNAETNELYTAPPEVSLTYFLKFFVSNEKQRLKIVNDVRNEEEYSPMRDHWKGIREGLTSRPNYNLNDTSYLDSKVAKANPKKRPSYQKAVDGYGKVIRLLHLDEYQKVDRLSGSWEYSGIKIKVAPEVHLVKPDGSDELVIKLYLNQSLPLTPMAAHEALSVMEQSLGAEPTRRFVVVDVIKGTVFSSDKSFPRVLDRTKIDITKFYRMWLGADRDAA